MNPLIAILGAGSARRFGGDKLAQPCAGKPLGRWAHDAARATGLLVVWVGGAEVPEFIDGGCNVIRNASADHGLSTSVACAVDAARQGGHDALLIMLADMPLIDTTLLFRLTGEGNAAACRYPDGGPGVPALVPAELFGGLRTLSGDRGAREFLSGLTDLRLVACDPAMLLDVDRPDDLARADRLLRAR